MKEYDKIYNSNIENGLKSFQLANGYISTTEIYFESENIVAKIEADGFVEFFDATENAVASINLPKQAGGKEKYTEVLCGVENSVIKLKFPIVEWIDNYPNCDGEHDRWDTKTIGYHTLTFDCNTTEITVE